MNQHIIPIIGVGEGTGKGTRSFVDDDTVMLGGVLEAEVVGL